MEKIEISRDTLFKLCLACGDKIHTSGIENEEDIKTMLNFMKEEAIKFLETIGEK